MEKEKGIVIRFVIGHSATPGGALDKAIDAEEAKHGDFLRLDHVEGYHRLSSKTRIYFSTAFSIWDAEFYVKVDDDVHLNLGRFRDSSLPIPSHFRLALQYPPQLQQQCVHAIVFAGVLAATLAQHRSKPRIYIGCMKSGPVLFQK